MGLAGCEQGLWHLPPKTDLTRRAREHPRGVRVLGAPGVRRERSGHDARARPCPGNRPGLAREHGQPADIAVW